ncbi:O-acyltransferase like protein [Galendromus occidentalis]|uniref:O-acyltransferase like protein n=1 Tax=Galendromus occidentalis TaxID=34638 RepID=A0AAJ6QNR1_9ACAR|nr:O-acyltransferase like protein [Galendromus occidentalis]
MKEFGLAFLLASFLSSRTCHAFDPMRFNPLKVMHDVEEVVEGFAKYLWVTGLSKPCSTAIQYSIRRFFKLEPWSVALFDSLGKIPPGLMMGTFNSMGHYDECLQVYTELDNETTPFKMQSFDHIAGRYCSVKIVFDGEYWLRRFSNTSSSMTNTTRALIRYMLKEDMYLLYEMNRMVDELPGFLGLCVPSQCTTNDMSRFFGFATPMLRAFAKVNLTFEVGSCKTLQDIEKAEMPILGKVLVTVTFLLVVVCVLSTLIQPARSKDSSALGSFLRCFSVRANARSLVQVDEDPLRRALHGLRGISVLWFITGNFLYLHSMLLTQNMLLLKDKIKDVWISFVLNYSLSEDTIIFVIAVFVSLAFQRRGPDLRSMLTSVSYMMMRVWPLGLFWMTFVVQVLPYVGHGPTWSLEMKRFTRNCSESWWRNVLLINNFWPRKSQCVEQLWFLAFIVQCSLAGLGLLTILYSKRRLGKMLFLDTIVATALVTGVLTLVHESGPTLLLREYRAGARHVYFDEIYTKIYTRGGVFLMGLWAGTQFSEIQNFQLSKFKNILGWFLSLSVIAAMVHSTYFWNQGQHLPGPIVSAIFASTHRLLWILPLIFIIISCATGKADVAAWILSWRIWQFSSRLVYCILLSHAYVIIFSNAVARSPFFFSYDYLSYLALHHIVLTMAVSFVLSLFVERPVVALLKFGKTSRERDNLVIIDMKPALDPILIINKKNATAKGIKNSFELK